MYVRLLRLLVFLQSNSIPMAILLVVSSNELASYLLLQNNYDKLRDWICENPHSNDKIDIQQEISRDHIPRGVTT